MRGKTYETAHGYTVEAIRRGVEVDLTTRNAKGETISTVVMDWDSATDLLYGLNRAV